MKTIFKIIIFLSFYDVTQAQATVPFITTWQTTSANESITIPTILGGYNYTVDWGDGNVITGYMGDATHTYTIPNSYTISITGVFPRIYFNTNGASTPAQIANASKILTVEQWGDNPWTSMESAFQGCVNLQGNFSDTPNLSNLTDMSSMFDGASSFNYPIDNWDVSTVTSMRGLFSRALLFNQNINSWTVSNVTDMSNMFSFMNFNEDISNWDVSSVTNMNNMFALNPSFNQNIGGWNVGNVTGMRSMFNFASSFNQNIGGWNVGNVTDMGATFGFASAFNQDIGGWNVGNVTNMNAMFSSAINFDQDIGGWNVSNVIDMSLMFFSASIFNQDIGNWNVGNVTNMNSMFSSATVFNQDIGNWNTANVTSMQDMFRIATNFNQNIGNWNVENVTTAVNMFGGVTLSTANYDALLIGWNTQNLQPNVLFSGGNSQYCEGEPARTNMINSYNWSITDGGLATPNINAIADQVVDNTFTFPIITGTQLSGFQAYYTDPNGTGTTYNTGDVINFTDFPSYPITLYIYDGTAACNDEESFLLTINEVCNMPTAETLADVTECTEYILPVLNTDNNYYSATNAGGTLLNAGDVITTSQTIFIYNGRQGCFDESSFDITIIGNVPVDNINNIVVCESYTLLPLTSGNYFTATNGTGTQLNAGDVITNSQTLFIYNGVSGCSNESSFTITINPLSPVDVLSNVTNCDNYILPPLSNGNYFTLPNGTGTPLNIGDIITTSQTLYIYNNTNGCPSESSFNITITPLMPLTFLPEEFACDSYTLPMLNSGNYFTQPNGLGTQLNEGDTINNSQTIFIYDTTDICPIQSAFDVTINMSPMVDILDDIATCGSFILPSINNGNYFTGTNGTGNQLTAGTEINTSQTVFIYQENSNSGFTCVSESSFEITIHPIIDFELVSSNLNIDNDQIVITITNSSVDYEYAIDNGSFQLSNVFSNLTNGTYTLFVRDQNACLEKSIVFEIFIDEFIIPKFFTPNGDNQNDVWQVIDTRNTINSIRIFDRYGKLLKEIAPSIASWDGTFNGNLMPSSDYWYTIEGIREDQNYQLTGHFTLKR